MNTPRLQQLIDRVAAALAYLSGATFLLLSFYVAWEALARKFGWPRSGYSDDISSYVMATAGTWAMAYALRHGIHVRIDVLVNLLPPHVRRVLTLLAILLTAVFAAMLAYYAWVLCFSSLALGTRAITPLQMPLWIPQSFVALGLSLLTLQSCAMLLLGLTNRPVFQREEVASHYE